MDRIKEVQEDPAKRKQALKSMLCSDSLHLAVCIAMVVVGAQVGNNALAMFMTTMWNSVYSMILYILTHIFIIF